MLRPTSRALDARAGSGLSLRSRPSACLAPRAPAVAARAERARAHGRASGSRDVAQARLSSPPREGSAPPQTGTVSGPRRKSADLRLSAVSRGSKPSERPSKRLFSLMSVPDDEVPRADHAAHMPPRTGTSPASHVRACPMYAEPPSSRAFTPANPPTMERGYTEFGSSPLLPDVVREALPLDATGEQRNRKLFRIGAITTGVLGALALVGVVSQVGRGHIAHAHNRAHAHATWTCTCTCRMWSHGGGGPLRACAPRRTLT